ncbi:hypothetical protein CJD36_015260 [Flavipsychrobacter stenotrophus]|uniref:Outer membrane protein beta-barrel domain-containing protein n=1 Tax=Flavipsychrobacter stenotrophus TaxID=2077091 RepID=A0A2S7STY6_9BACT|nr:autotransporter domain-containing protein [Flavipsychrobacter stenotrophus]PQJ10055.1 hypothetical protein CJD36_015260 [Flavipsychrobacter stenotrophus]
MKPIILLASSVMLLSTVTSYAQKNTWIVDAGANVNHQTIPSYSSGYPSLSLSGAGLNIAIGRQLSNHFAVGILGGYGSQQQLIGDYSGISSHVYKATFNTWNIGVYGRYTYWLNKHLYLYSQLSATHHDYSVKSELLQYNYPVVYQPYFTSGTQPDGLDVTLLPAVGVNLIKGYGIHADVGGLSYTRTGGGGNAVNGVNLNIGQSFHFGLHKIIGWKKMNSTPNDPNAMLK